MLRLLVTPRWLGWTVLALLTVVVCGGMAYWQLVRAESPSGSLLNAGYALQWPLFGVFFAGLWWRMLRLEARMLDRIRRGEDPEDPKLLEDEPGPDPEPAAPIAADGRRSRRRQAEPIGPTPAGTPFRPRPAGVTVGGADAVPAAGSARARYNAMLTELARDGDPTRSAAEPEHRDSPEEREPS